MKGVGREGFARPHDGAEGRVSELVVGFDQPGAGFWDPRGGDSGTPMMGAHTVDSPGEVIVAVP